MICMHLGRESVWRNADLMLCTATWSSETRGAIYPTSKALRVRVSIRNNMVQAPNLNRMGITIIYSCTSRIIYHSTWMDFGLCLLTGGSRFGAGPIYKVNVLTPTWRFRKECWRRRTNESKARPLLLPAVSTPSRRFVGHRHVSSRSDTQKPTWRTMANGHQTHHSITTSYHQCQW